MQLIHKAISEIRRRTPWIGIVLQMVEVIPSESVPTAATNGKQVLVNLQYAARLSFANLMGVLVHEALHIIMRHVFRIKGRDPKRFNIACDHAINGLVVDLGYSLPKNCLKRIDNATAEMLYGDDNHEHDGGEFGDRTDDYDQTGEDNESDSGDSSSASSDADPNADSDSDSGDDNTDGTADSSGGESEGADGDDSATGEFGDDPGDSDILEYPLEPGQTMEDAEREINDLLNRAKTTAIVCGEEAGDLEKTLFEPVESTTDWNDELAEFLTLAGSGDFSLMPPNLILGSNDIIANRLNPSGLGNIVFVIDNSSSMDEDKLRQVVSELIILVDSIDYESVRFISCDTKVNQDILMNRGEPIDTDWVRVAGGTKFKPAFDYIEDNGYECDLLIYFTDMEIEEGERVPEHAPDYPVLWAVYGRMLDDDLNWFGDSHPAYDYFSPDWGHRVKIG